MSTLGTAIAGGNAGRLADAPRARQAADFYPTPAEVTVALLDWWCLHPRHRIWEPACGAGDMARVLLAGGHRVIATDLHDRGYGAAGVDFLTADIPAGVDAIVTNPPFNLAAEFIRRWIDMAPIELGTEGIHAAPRYLALLLKAQYWHAATRLRLWRRWRPYAVLPLTWRPDFMNLGAPTMDIAWVIWDRNHVAGGTLYEPLPRPAGSSPQC